MGKRRRRRSSSGLHDDLPPDGAPALTMSKTPWFCHIFPPSPDASSWAWLDYELCLFQLYVQLHHTERKARANVILEIEKIAADQFSTPPSHRDGEREDFKVPFVSVEAFGSYACQPVCCFLSDIDLAVWGVFSARPPQVQEFGRPGDSRSGAVAFLPSGKRLKLVKEHNDNFIDLTDVDDDQNEFSEPEIIDLTGDDDADGNSNDDNNTGIPLSYMHMHIPSSKQVSSVVGALLRLKAGLRQNAFWATQLFVRQNARVPIINFATTFGFKVDIAMGGHPGMDTNLFANNMCAYYKSFAPVVLTLKIILNQHGLDKPCTGGLGSYKLYVLVAYHLSQHVANHGSDQPGDVLMGFLSRYGVKNCSTFTNLLVVPHVKCHGATAVISGVHQKERLVNLFHGCWDRMSRQIQAWDGNNCPGIDPPSFLAKLVRVEELDSQRRDHEIRALKWTELERRQRQSHPHSKNSAVNFDKSHYQYGIRCHR